MLNEQEKTDRINNYNQSNSILTIPNLTFLNCETQKLYSRYREAKEITQEKLQKLSDAIFSDLGLIALNISFKGRRPHKSDGKRIVQNTLGVHRSAMSSQSIQIYALTAARQDKVKPKTAISTLLHEINHNLDYNILKLRKSIHCKGFYIRLKHLTEAIGG